MKKAFSLVLESKRRKITRGALIMNKANISALFFCILTSIFQQDIYAQANEESPANDFNALFSFVKKASLASPLDAIDRLYVAANPYASQSLPAACGFTVIEYGSMGSHGAPSWAQNRTFLTLQTRL